MALPSEATKWLLLQPGRQFVDAPHYMPCPQGPLVERGHTRRIVAAVFQTLKPFEQYLRRLLES